MKKTVALLICITMIFFLQFGRDVRVNTSIRTSGENGSKEYLNVTANKICIFDKEKFAQEIIRRRIENSYKEIFFIEQYPDEIEVNVYLNRLMWEMKRKAFSIIYEYDGSESYTFKIEYMIPVQNAVQEKSFVNLHNKSG